jgi:hypothetical protein
VCFVSEYFEGRLRSYRVYQLWTRMVTGGDSESRMERRDCLLPQRGIGKEQTNCKHDRYLLYKPDLVSVASHTAADPALRGHGTYLSPNSAPGSLSTPPAASSVYMQANKYQQGKNGKGATANDRRERDRERDKQRPQRGKARKKVRYVGRASSNVLCRFPDP